MAFVSPLRQIQKGCFGKGLRYRVRNIVWNPIELVVGANEKMLFNWNFFLLRLGAFYFSFRKINVASIGTCLLRYGYVEFTKYLLKY